jgi:hypothetical protein
VNLWEQRWARLWVCAWAQKWVLAWVYEWVLHSWASVLWAQTLARTLADAWEHEVWVQPWAPPWSEQRWASVSVQLLSVQELGTVSW